MTNAVQSYIGTLGGWQAALAEELRSLFLAEGVLEEQFKWGHPMYVAQGPVCLFKAHKAHVALGFWRGADMREIDERLVPGGSFSMASIKLTENMPLDADRVRRLVTHAIELNARLGDPTKAG